MKSPPKGGYTLIELTVAIGIMVMLFAIGFSAFQSYLSQQGLNAAVEHAVAVLARGRSYTLGSFDTSGGAGRNYGIHIDAADDTMVLFF